MCFQKNIIHPAPSKIFQQASKSQLHVVKVVVVSEACFDGNAWLPWLFRVDFPRMEIKNPGLLVDPIYTPKSPPKDRVWYKPEITAAATRKVSVHQLEGSDWDLDNTISIVTKCEARRIRTPIVIVIYRIYTRAVAISGLV